MPTLSAATAIDTSALAALVGLIVQVFIRPYVNGPSKTDYIRMCSTVLGAIVATLFVFTSGAHPTPENVRNTIVAGLVLGASVTYAVATVKGDIALPSISLNKRSTTPPTS